MKLKIVQAGESVLRQVARSLPPDEVKSAATRQLIDLMRETMRDAPGVGLAAPQVGESLQIVVIEDRFEYQQTLPAEVLIERERTEIPFQVIINPVITVDESVAPEATFFETCLSVSGFAALVPRARSVRVECIDENAAPRIIEAEGWYARILQHEIDHLKGILYVDRMNSRTFINQAIYAKNFHAKTNEEIAQTFPIP